MASILPSSPFHIEEGIRRLWKLIGWQPPG
jgi:hypothetical protein